MLYGNCGDPISPPKKVRINGFERAKIKGDGSLPALMVSTWVNGKKQIKIKFDPYCPTHYDIYLKPMSAGVKSIR